MGHWGSWEEASQKIPETAFTDETEPSRGFCQGANYYLRASRRETRWPPCNSEPVRVKGHI